MEINLAVLMCMYLIIYQSYWQIGTVERNILGAYMLYFEYEMSPRSSYVWTLGPQLVVLFGA